MLWMCIYVCMCVTEWGKEGQKWGKFPVQMGTDSKKNITINEWSNITNVDASIQILRNTDKAFTSFHGDWQKHAQHSAADFDLGSKWHGIFLGALFPPDGNATANQHKCILSDYPHSVMKHFHADESDLCHHDNDPINKWFDENESDESESYATGFAVITSQHNYTAVGDFGPSLSISIIKTPNEAMSIRVQRTWRCCGSLLWQLTWFVPLLWFTVILNPTLCLSI